MRHLSAASLVIAAATGCGTSTAPRSQSAPIDFVAGENQTDTVSAVLAQALVVRINRVPQGQQLRPGETVQFIAVQDSSGDYEAQVMPLASSTPVSFVAESLNAYGQASVVVVLGPKAGPARLIVKVPNFGYVDTARFTVKPGNVARVVASPADTTVIVGAAVRLRVSAEDRFGNPRPDSVHVAVISGPATVAGSTVTTTAIGRIALQSTISGATDTIYISSAPTGMLAASNGSGIAIANFDGSNYKVLTFNGGVGLVKWAPSGTSLVFDQNGPACYGGGNRIQTTDLSGNLKTVDVGPVYDAYPTYSRDGTWIYFTTYASSTGSTRRVHPDGTGDDSLATLNPWLDLFPSPSPDGQQVAYGAYEVAYPNDSLDLRILTIGSGAVVDLQIRAWSPEWSPTSSQIAYIHGTRCDQGNIAIVNADGTGAHTLTTDPYQPGFDWSPDGKWLVAVNAATGHLDVINASTGATVPLTWTNGIAWPTWKP